ncbi:MAG: type III pantothenate kinase [Aquificaceae bacterium]
MTTLTLDVGNTTVDACILDERGFRSLGKFFHRDINKLKGKYDRVYVASVKPSFNPIIERLFGEVHFIEPKDIPLRLSFEGKEKVGVDRLLNLYGAMLFYSENSLVVSCGTAMVLDLLVDGTFIGGFITLGLSGKLRCLAEKAELIPDIELRRFDVAIGKDTETAVIGGILKEARSFVLSFFQEVREGYGRDLSLIITGGDGWLLQDLGTYEPHLIHRAILKLCKLS